ncbi:MAG TPA: GNAT family N-acetyltransferase [Actinomycetota bacterium]|nr:GNAT family N-acetyltransferase [Actinomycetota bacterium]
MDAWELARAAATSAGIRLRALGSLEDFDAAIEVMTATWGPYQLLPREVITALAHSGNVPWGAFDADRMIGFVLGWAGVDDDGLHVHSHMLATLPDRRHRGVGFALKLAQRAQALDQGIRVARWTFDPLVARNAWFNLGKLGATADRFGRSFYGEMTDDLNRGDRADRLVVRWDLEPQPGPRPIPGGLPTQVRAVGDPPRPERGEEPADGGATIEVPRDHQGLRTDDPDLGARWRDAVAEALEAGLGAGLVVSAFDRDRSAYVLTPRTDA